MAHCAGFPRKEGTSGAQLHSLLYPSQARWPWTTSCCSAAVSSSVNGELWQLPLQACEVAPPHGRALLVSAPVPTRSALEDGATDISCPTQFYVDMKREHKHAHGCEFIKSLACIPLTLQDSFLFFFNFLKISRELPCGRLQ